jgi:hypothetical protein
MESLSLRVFKKLIKEGNMDKALTNEGQSNDSDLNLKPTLR